MFLFSDHPAESEINPPQKKNTKKLVCLLGLTTPHTPRGGDKHHHSPPGVSSKNGAGARQSKGHWEAKGLVLALSCQEAGPAVPIPTSGGRLTQGGQEGKGRGGLRAASGPTSKVEFPLHPRPDMIS